jgi:hypothetical protein
MRKPVKIIIFVSSYLLVFALGFCGALWYFGNSIKNIAFASNMSILSHYSMLAETEHGLGNDASYRDALLTFLTALDKARTPGDPVFTEKSNQIDKTLTYTRLGLIEKKLGDTGKSQEYFDRATEACNKSGWKDCSMNKLVSVVEKLDKNSVFNQPEEKDK